MRGIHAFAFVLAAAGIAFYLILYLAIPNAPRGFMTLLVAVLLIGAIQLFSLSIIAEYLGRIFEEVKQRPHFIRRSVIRDGEIRSASTDLVQR